MNLEEHEDLEKLLDSQDIERYQLVGSTYILGKKGKDIDYIVQVPLLDLFVEVARRLDYYFSEGSMQPGDDFYCFRKDDVNLIVTNNTGFFDRFVLAAKVCRHVKAEDKQMRIDLHKLIRDGEIPETYPVF